MRSSHRLLVAGLGACSALGLGVVGSRYWPRSPVAEGVLVGDRRVPDDGSPATWLANRQLDALGWLVRFHHDGEIVEATLGDVGVELDVQRSLERASEVAHSGSVSLRLKEASRARRGEVNVPLVFFFDEKKARAFFESVAPGFYVAPVDAVLDIENKRRVEDVPGRELDVDACIAELRDAAFEDGVPIRLVTRRVPAKVTASDLGSVDVTRVVSSFETSFTTFGSGAGRSVNIHNAARKIDGVVLMPGDVFSFNDRVGPRTRENGFTLAPEIQGDELTDGIGGGTCQLSSTLHGAVVFGAIEVLQRKSHSRASSYTKLGLDATVSYPVVDLKIRNSLSFPIMFHAYFPAQSGLASKVRVEILGGDPVAKVEYAYGVGGSYDFVRRITVKNNLPPGKRIHRQKGVRGFDVTSTAKVVYHDGRVEERHWYSGYRPSPEVFWVSPGYDESALPPLPDHAKGVEGRLDGAMGAATEPASLPLP